MNGRGQGDDGDPGDERWDDPDDGVMRGWIPPDDRLWRHPSEAGAASTGPSRAPDTRGRSDPRPSGPWIVLTATACVIVALVATGVAMVASGSAGGPGTRTRGGIAGLVAEPTTEPGAEHLPGETALADMVATARQSVVAVQVGTATGSSNGTGIVAESGGIIVTSSQLLSGARSVSVVESSGTRQAADVVGTDRTTNLAVLRIADDLPAASFNRGDPPTDSIEVALALRTAAGTDTPPTAEVYAGTVASVGRSVDPNRPAGAFSDSVVEAPLSEGDIGCPLLDGGGQVWGMLEWTDSSSGSTAAVFLPAETVLGVTQQLVSSGEVDEGWLGVETSDTRSPLGANRTTVTTTSARAGAPTATTAVTTLNGAPSSASAADGARIDSVDNGSPAAGAGLQEGDVIVGVDRLPIHSSSELETRLYADAPGTQLNLSVVRDGSVLTAPVLLADADTDASGAAPSP